MPGKGQRNLTHFTAHTHTSKTHPFNIIYRKQPSVSLAHPCNVAADTTDLSTTSLAPQFHPRATGTHFFSKKLTRTEPKWQLPALKWLPACRIDAESREWGAPKNGISTEERFTVRVRCVFKGVCLIFVLS